MSEDLISNIQEVVAQMAAESQRDLTLVVGPTLMATVETKASELGFVEITAHADGGRKITIRDINNPGTLSADERDFLDIVRHVVFRVAVPLLPPAVVKPDPRERMDNLRRITRQDWRRRH